MPSLPSAESIRRLDRVVMAGSPCGPKEQNRFNYRRLVAETGTPVQLVDCQGQRTRLMTVRGMPPYGKVPMSIQMVLLPVFVQVGLTFALLIGMVLARRRTLVAGETKIRDIALGEPNWPKGATQIANCYRNQFELPVLFYVLIALALPLRHADLFIVLMSWVFVVTRFAHAGVFVSSNDLGRRSTVWLASVLVLLAMWIYFALKMLLLI
ncbi:hypothetical protein C7G42_28260 [Bradyrhizobium sp. MOS003]|nr:hypothetical protein C7G42_28260 [Bradyrhizobium sp. MOS003]